MGGRLARVLALVGLVLAGAAAAQESELQRVLDRVLAPPELRPAPGLRAQLLVKPGSLYDPLWLRVRAGPVWLNDDGGEENERGSRIVSLAASGRIEAVLGLGRLLPVTGFDIAPASWGARAGHIFMLVQPGVGESGAQRSHLVQHVDPASTLAPETLCALPDAGSGAQRRASFGMDARFGPDGTAFAGRFFAVTGGNSAVYEVTPDGSCKPFASFDLEKEGMALSLHFAPDGRSVWVGVGRDAGGSIEKLGPAGERQGRVGPAAGLTRPMGMTIAPAGFGRYAGELFIADPGIFETPVPATQALAADGRVLRLGSEGALHEVLAGLVNPADLAFVGGALWVTDVNGDFIAGHRELPDGFVAVVEVAR